MRVRTVIARFRVAGRRLRVEADWLVHLAFVDVRRVGLHFLVLQLLLHYFKYIYGQFYEYSNYLHFLLYEARLHCGACTGRT